MNDTQNNYPTHLAPHSLKKQSQARRSLKNQTPCVIWFTGLSGAGKSTLAIALENYLIALQHHTFLLDGDNIRTGLCSNLGFTSLDREENIRRVSEVAKLMTDAGLIVIVSLISPYYKDRLLAKNIITPARFIEVFVDTPLHICEQRDPKGFYKKARSGIIPQFTGISSPYEAPKEPDIIIDTSQLTIDASIKHLIKEISEYTHIHTSDSCVE